MATRTPRRKSSPRKLRSKPSICYFCQSESNPSYKNYNDLSRFITDRARIVGRERSGVCAKHQRKLAVAIKRARYLGLFPFQAKI